MACKRDAGFLVVANDLCEVYAFDLESGMLMLPVLRVGKTVASLTVAANQGSLCFAVLSRDARLWIPKVATGVPVDPVTSLFETGGIEVFFAFPLCQLQPHHPPHTN